LLAREAHAPLFDDARIPPRYRNCTFENFQVYPNEKLTNAAAKGAEVRRALSRRAEGLLPDRPARRRQDASRRGDAARRAEPRQPGPLLRGVGPAARHRNTYNPVTKTAEMDVLQPLLTAQLLVLDDVGKEKTSEWVEETMTFIVNSRYNQKLVTIFTSNYEDTPDIDVLDSLRVRVGSRMYSRMHEMCDFIEYGGADYRLLPPNGGVDDLMALWKVAGEQKSKLPTRAKNQLRAQMKPAKELGWSGGKHGT
jgi:DNA replication protein DnaC